jgi:alpha-galactosidase/6-phospho-beta-glucosidase family protein
MPKFHFVFVLTSTDEETKSFREVVDLTEGKLRKDTMIEEMESLHKNDMWDLFKLPNGRNPIGSKWIFKKNMNATAQVEKFKAHLVAKGYSQVEGVDFGENFSPIEKSTSIRALISLVATFYLEIEQMDVKITFLHEDLEE